MAITRRRFMQALGAGAAMVSVGCGGGGGADGSGGTITSGGSAGAGGGAGNAGGTSADPGGGGVQPADPPAPAMLTGRIVRPGDADYDAARGNYNGRFSVRPQVIVFAATADDVANAVRWARQNGVALRPRSGRHSYEGYSLVDDGLVLDVSAMAGIAYDAGSGRARLGAGCTMMQVYEGLAPSGVMIPTGSCGSLGLAGVTLGGGVGLVSRQFGLTCDAVRAIDLVTADGTITRASAAQNPDLFWALRGGGGGNFGIVTGFEFQAAPAADVAIYSVSWPLADFAQVMQAWQGWAPYTDPRLFSVLSVDGTRVNSIGQMTGSVDELKSVAMPLTSCGAAMNLTYQQLSFLEAARMFGDDDAASRPKFKNSSAYVAAPLSDAALAAIVAQVSNAPGPSNTIQFDSLGGAIADVAGDATAFAHRHALCSIQLEAFWQNDSDAAANIAWVQRARAALLPYTSGAYVNYIDGDITDFAQQYYGDNLGRLAQIKRTWDPDGFFAFPQAIPT